VILFGFVFSILVLAVSPAMVASSPEKPSVICPLLTQPVTIDGKWTSTTEWTDAPETQMTPAAGNGTAYFRCKHDATYVYILGESLVDTEAESYVTTVNNLTLAKGDIMGMNLDTRHNDGELPSTDDYEFAANYVNASYTQLLLSIGNGKAWVPTVHIPGGAEAVINLDTENSPHPPHPHVTGEFKIPLSLIQAQVFGFYMFIDDSSGALDMSFSWPAAGPMIVSSPSEWGDMWISSAPLQSSTIVSTMQPTPTQVTTSSFVSTSPVSPAASTSVQTVYSTITMTRTLSRVLNATGPQYCATYWWSRFPGLKEGQQLMATIESNSSIDFYLLTKADYDFWNGSGCYLSSYSPVVNQTGITHYDLSITVPSDGTYYMIFINRSPDKAASVTLLQSSVTTKSLVLTLSTSVTTSYVTAASSAVSPSATSANIQVAGEDDTPVLAAVVAAFVFVLAYIVGMRRARSAPPPPPPPK
jgi:hypothetical protein